MSELTECALERTELKVIWVLPDKPPDPPPEPMQVYSGTALVVIHLMTLVMASSGAKMTGERIGIISEAYTHRWSSIQALWYWDKGSVMARVARISCEDQSSVLARDPFKVFPVCNMRVTSRLTDVAGLLLGTASAVDLLQYLTVHYAEDFAWIGLNARSSKCCSRSGNTDHHYHSGRCKS